MVYLSVTSRDQAQWIQQKAEASRSGTGSLNDLVVHNEALAARLSEDFENISSGRFPVDNSRKQRLLSAIWASSEVMEIPPELHGFFPSATSFIPENMQTTISHRITNSLIFPGMALRDERISPAYPDTFNWLFDPPPERERTAYMEEEQARAFIKWCRSSTDEAFWITGKPASGKSTLMKFISAHPALHSQLEIGTSHFHRATFYFWGPGSRMQKSLEGLLMALLHQLLSQRPDLCEIVAPRRSLLLGVGGPEAASPTWTLSELKNSLIRFASRVRKESSRLILFIDGLDEFSGPPEELLGLLSRLQRDDGIKLCVASRQWTVFWDAFRQNPSLRMEALTRPDIDKFITGRFKESRAIDDLKKVPQFAASISELIEQIRTRAEGVFLWVVLVVEQLLLTARDTPSLKAIWDAFSDIPGDLQDLYDQIHNDASLTRKEITSKLYRLVMEWKRTLNNLTEATALWAAVNYSDLTTETCYPRPSEEGNAVLLLERLLAGHTKGLLQLSRSTTVSEVPTVDFLHRTAFDWVREAERWDTVCSWSPGFHPTITLVATFVSQLYGLVDTSQHPGKLQDFHRDCIVRIFQLSAEVENTSDNRAALIRILDRIAIDALLPPNIHSFFGATYLANRIRNGEREITRPVEILAAAWCCKTYLADKLDRLDQCELFHDVSASSALRRWVFRERYLGPVSILEAAVLGGPLPPVESVNEIRLFKAVKYTGEVERWNTRCWGDVWVLRRLETISLILQANSKSPSRKVRTPEASLQDLLFNPRQKRKSSPEYVYWELLHEAVNPRRENRHTLRKSGKASHNSQDLFSLDSEARKRFPRVHRSASRLDFPDFPPLTNPQSKIIWKERLT